MKTVNDLIQLLQAFPPDAELYINSSYEEDNRDEWQSIGNISSARLITENNIQLASQERSEKKMVVLEIE